MDDLTDDVVNESRAITRLTPGIVACINNDGKWNAFPAAAPAGWIGIPAGGWSWANQRIV